MKNKGKMNRKTFMEKVKLDRKLEIIKQNKHFVYLGCLAILLLLLDLFTKRWAYNDLLGQQSKEILGTFLKFEFVWNPGTAFGFIPSMHVFGFVIINLIVTVVGGYFAFVKNKQNLARYFYIAVVIGGWGNVIDRFIPEYDGRVVDFINMSPVPAVFNLADVWVVGGTIGIAILVFLSDMKDKKENKK